MNKEHEEDEDWFFDEEETDSESAYEKSLIENEKINTKKNE